MKSYIFGLLSGLLIAFIYSIISGLSKNEELEQFSLFNPPIKSKHVADAPLASKAEQNTDLSNQPGPRNEKFSSSSSNKAEILSAAAVQVSNEIAAIMAVQSELKEIEDFTRLNKQSDFSSAVDSVFKSENVDASWANESEANIQRFFRDTPEILNYPPDLIECRTTRCKVSLVIADKEKMVDVSQIVLEEIDKNSYELTKKVMVTMNRETGSLFFYIAKDESIKLYQ